MFPWQPEFLSNQPKTLCSLSSYLMMLYMKFDQNWSTDFTDMYYFVSDHCHNNTSLEPSAQVS